MEYLGPGGSEWKASGSCRTTTGLFTVRYIPHPSTPSLPTPSPKASLPIPAFTYHRLNNPDPPCALCSTPGTLPEECNHNGSPHKCPRSRVPGIILVPSFCAHSPLPLLPCCLPQGTPLQPCLVFLTGSPERSQSPLPGRTLSCFPVPLPLPPQALTLGF